MQEMALLAENWGSTWTGSIAGIRLVLFGFYQNRIARISQSMCWRRFNGLIFFVLTVAALSFHDRKETKCCSVESGGINDSLLKNLNLRMLELIYCGEGGLG